VTTGTAEDQFRAALEKDAGMASPPAPPPPPRRDPDAPHGRDDQGQPLAPYGSKADGTPRIKPAGPGRAGKAAQGEQGGPGGAVDKPRVTVAAPPPGAAQAAAGRDFGPQLDDLVEGSWALLSSLPIPWAGVRIRIHAQAAILHMNKPGLVRGGNVIAQHSPPFASKVDALTTGGAAWMLPALFALAPFVGQSLAMWRSPAAGDIERLAGSNELAFRAMLDAAAEQLAAEVQREHERIQEAAQHAQQAA
jgi:hypothetical protein